MLSKFRLYDQNNSGFIEQTDFKTVLGELGVSLNLNELIKIVKFIPINKQNHLKYAYAIDKLYVTESGENEVLSESEFRETMKNILKSNAAPFAVPISVLKLTSLLQAKYLKKY